MTYIGQIELTKKKPPKVDNDNRAWSDLYDTLNHLIDSVNSKSTTEQRRPGDLHNSIGDLKVFKDKTDNKYYMETMTEDGSARREMFISDKDSRSGDDFYSLAGKKTGGGGLSGSKDGRNIEQQLFEQIPWTGGIPNNITLDADGKIVTDTVAGAIISNNYIVQADLVGSGKTWADGQKPNQTTIDNDGQIVLDDVAGATVTNAKIVAADVVGSGKTFTTKPPVTFRQDGIPTSLTIGDLWYDTNDGNKLYIALSVGADAITGGEWVATVDATIATAQADADTADGKAVAAQNTANTALSSANGKNVSFYSDQSPIPTALAAGDMWFDTSDEYKMYRAAAAGADAITAGEWVIVNAVPTLAAVTISASNINAGAVTAGKIATNAVTANTIVADAITAAKIATDAVTADAIQANSVSASEIAADTITADQINTANITTAVVTSTSVNATDINADNITAGTLTAAEINMASGSAQIETSGKITTKNLVKCFSTDVGGSRMGLRLIEHGDTSSADSGSSNWWQLFVDSDDLIFNKGGSNICEFTDDGLMIGDEGVGFNTSAYNMKYDSGHIQVNLNAENTDGLSIYPNYHSTGTTVGHDLGKSTKKWRKIFVVQSNVGDLRMSNDIDADWTLREKSDCILARNSKTQKTFKLNMTETSEYDSEVWDEND